MTSQARDTTTSRLNRGAVLATAAGLADEHGLRHVTVSAVARAVGVRTPSLYTHVRGNDDLRVGLAALALGELADRGDRALAGRSGREALEAWAEAQRDYARVPEEERIHAARYVAGTLRGFVELEAGGAFGHRKESLEESWTRTIDALDRSLRDW